MVKIEIIATAKVGDLIQSYLERFYAENEGVYFNLARYGGNQADVSLIHKRAYSPLMCVIEIDDPSFNGYEVAKMERESDPLLPIFFVSQKGYGQPQKIFEHHPYDFLIYPFSYEAFVKAAKAMMKFLSFLHSKNEATYAFKAGAKYHELVLDDILYIEKDNHNLVFHTARANIVGRGRLSDVENDLSAKSPDFIKCNKGTLVNLHYVTQIDGNDLKILKHSIPISRSEKKKVLEAYKDYASTRMPKTGRGDGDPAKMSEFLNK